MEHGESESEPQLFINNSLVKETTNRLKYEQLKEMKFFTKYDKGPVDVKGWYHSIKKLSAT